MTHAQDYLKQWQTLPTKLSSVYTPLKAKPESGKTVIKLSNGQIPSDSDSFVALKAAASAIGWTAKNVIFDGSVEDLNAKMESAIAEKPAVITLAGWPVAAISKPIADAKAAGVVISLSSILDAPISNPGYAALTNGGPTITTIAKIWANWFMNDSKCSGSLEAFSIPFPIIDYGMKALTKEIESNCPNCTVKTAEIQTKDLGTPAATNTMVSAVQSDPKIKYVVPAIANLATGLASAYQQANLSGIKIMGSVPDVNAIKALQDKTNAMWVVQSSLMNGWTQLDGALRAIESGKTVTDTGGYPLAMLTQDNVPSGSAVPVYPTDYQSEFKALWHVG